MTADASGSNGILVADDDNIDFGTGDFTLSWIGSPDDWGVSVLSSIVENFYGLIRKWSSNLGVSFGFDRVNDGSFKQPLLFINGNSYYSGAAVSLSGKIIASLTVSVVRETASTAGSVTFYLNGAQLGSAQTIAAGAPATVNNTENMYVSGRNVLRHDATVLGSYAFNRALSAAEVLDLSTNGIADADKWGSQTPVYSSDFSAGVDSWEGASGASVTGNVDSIGGENDWLETEVSAANNSACRRGISLANGKNTKTKLKVYIPSANATVNGIRVSYLDSSFAITLEENFTGLTLDAVNEIEFSPGANTADVSRIRIYSLASGSTSNNTTGDKFYIKEVEVKQIGATLALETTGLDGTSTWTDSSDNGLNATLPASGATVITTEKP